MRRPIHKVGIVGAGQIGTSLTIAIARALPDAAIAICDKNPHLENDFARALHEKAGLKMSQRLQFGADPAALKGSTIAIYAVPTGQYGPVSRQLTATLTSDTTLTDVGSVKGPAIAAAQKELAPNFDLVPAHIFNGNAGTGPLSASGDVFQGKPLFLIPHIGSSAAEKEITNFWELLGCRIFKVSAHTHDQLQATMSGMEHLWMFALMQCDFVRDLGTDRGLADPGNWIQRMTRIADASPEMWAANFADNSFEIRKTSKRAQEILAFDALLLQQVRPSLQRRIVEGHRYAETMPTAGMTAIDLEASRGSDLKLSAFVGSLSLAITQNVSWLEKETNKSIADFCNPSLKDGTGPMAVDPLAVERLLISHDRFMPAMRQEFVMRLDRLTKLLDRPLKMIAEIERISADRKRFPVIFSSPPTLSAPSAANVPSLR